MKVIGEEELAMLLHETHFSEEESLELCGCPKVSWYEEAEFNRDDYRAQARRILKLAKVALRPTDNTGQN